MPKLEWYFIGLINAAAYEYANRHDASAFWRWYSSSQHDEWIRHKDGPNQHPNRWEGWMVEFV